jgi:hypothetical protein
MTSNYGCHEVNLRDVVSELRSKGRGIRKFPALLLASGSVATALRTGSKL